MNPGKALPDPYLAEIRAQPDAIRRAAEAIAEQRELFEEVRVAAAERRRFVLTGMGSSHDACYPAVDELASRGALVLHANAAEILHFRSRLVTAKTLLIIVSQSGESAEVVRLAEQARSHANRPFLVSVTNGLVNPLAERADVRLDTRAGVETAPSSMTFAASLVHLSLLARLLSGDEPQTACSEVAEAASDVAARVEAVLGRADLVETKMMSVARGRRIVAIIGRGKARATVEMGALTLMECGVVAEGFEAGAFRHGPFELAGVDLGALVVATEPRTRELELVLVAELRRADAAVIVLTDDDAASDESGTLVLPCVDPLLSPALSIVPIQLAAHRLAVEAGRSPGEYRVASKVTTRE